MCQNGNNNKMMRLHWLFTHTFLKTIDQSKIELNSGSGRAIKELEKRKVKEDDGLTKFSKF